jgi:SUMO ligase MMS21 Smc5/6 complex component
MIALRRTHYYCYYYYYYYYSAEYTAGNTLDILPSSSISINHTLDVHTVTRLIQF